MWRSLVLALAPTTALAAPTARGEVAGKDGQACQVELRGDPKADAVVFTMMGSGLYAGIDDDGDDFIADRIERGEVSVLMMNKPGVLGPDPRGEPTHYDFERYSAYTVEGLVQCGLAALDWAEEQREGPLRWILRGHSEGALVQAQVAQRRLAEGKALLGVTLSGVPMQDLDDNLARQYGERTFDKWLRKQEPRYQKAPREWTLKRQMSLPTFKALATQRITPALDALLVSKTPLQIHQGLRDQNTIPEALRAWEQTFTAPWVTIQYFEADHGGNYSMMHSQLSWIDARLFVPRAGSFFEDFDDVPTQ